MARLALVCVLFCTLHVDTSTSVKQVKAVFDSTTWEKPLGWCLSPTGQLFTGDFNGDGRQDMLCHNPTNGYKWINYARCDGTFTNDNVWERDMGFCFGTNARLFVGDFNGDGRTDILCHNIKTGYKWVSLALLDGGFLVTSWEYDMGFCISPAHLLLIDDFNADGRDDMLCHHITNGYKWIAYARQDGGFPGVDWHLAMGWCLHTSAQLFTGDFNGDRRADLLCHDQHTGYKWVALASSSGAFSTTSWEANLSWCNKYSEKLYIGDFNKDKRADMLCHDIYGNKGIAFASRQGSFSGSDWGKVMGYCGIGSLFITDVNGDGGDDLLCHRSSDGYKWIALNQY